jgi:lipopolysaccharide transport system permease protein
MLEIFKKGTSENFLLKQLIKKNFISKYKDSIIGIFWSFLNPLLTMILLTAIFSTIFSGNINNYPVYFLTGRCIFDFFNFGTKSAMDSLKTNKNILNKVFVNRYIFPISSVSSEFLNFLISLIILVLVMFFTNSHFYFSSIFVVIPILSLVLLITGVGLILSIIRSYFTDIKYLYNVFTMLLMYASALFYPIEIIPVPIRQYIELNPIYLIIDQFRDFLMYGNMVGITDIINIFLFSLIVLIIGIAVFKKYQKKITLEL